MSFAAFCQVIEHWRTEFLVNSSHPIFFYRRAMRYFRSDLRRIGILLLFTGFGIAVSLLQVWPMSILLDTVLSPMKHTDFMHRLFSFVLPTNKIGQVIGITLIGMGLKFAQDITGVFREMMRRRIDYNGMARVRSDCFDKLQRMSMDQHRARPQGDTIFRLTTDSAGPRDIFDVLFDAGVAAVTLIVVTVIMFFNTVPLTVFALAVAPVLIGCNVYFGRIIRRRQLISRERDAEFTTSVQRSVTAMALIRAFGREKHEAAGFSNAVSNVVNSTLRLDWQTFLAGFATQTIFSVGGAMVFGYGGYLAYRDEFVHPISNGFSAGNLVAFMGYLGMMWGPLATLATAAAAVQKGAAGSQRIFELLDLKEETTDSDRAHVLTPVPRVLTLDNVHYEYELGRPVLQGVNAVIKPGEVVAFVGPSGAGKSTLLQLLPRFADPTTGSVRFDGTDLRSIRRQDVRRHVSLVLQDSLVLPATIRENISYGRPDASLQQIRQAARMAGADSFIAKLPLGYDTMVEESGQNLSGGQRQRLAIARSLLSPAPFLIMDEPTAALDAESEQRVLDFILAQRKRRTVILVTHSLTAASRCDKVFVMQAGRIVERGTPAELLNRNGVFADLVKTGELHSVPHAA